MAEDKGFFAVEKELNKADYVIADYFFETFWEPEKAAIELCKEQSTALWSLAGNPGMDLREKHGAKILGIKVGAVKEKPLTNAFLAVKPEGKKFSSGIMRIAHPIINFGYRLPNLLTTLIGEGTFNASSFTAIKLVNVEFPESFLKKFQGPKFGLDGVRKKLNVSKRPLFCGVIKPNVGLKVDDFARIAYQGLKGGLDIVKDDELMSDTGYSATKERAQKVMQGLFRAEEETGEKKLYVCNITDEVDKILELHDLVVSLGGNAVMLNAFPVGLSCIRMLAKKTRVPIVSHFVSMDSITRSSFFGVSYHVMTLLQRIAGADLIITPGVAERMATTQEDFKANINACLAKMPGIKESVPAFGGGDWAGTIKQSFDLLKTKDFCLVVGSGAFGHPKGPESGAKSLRQAWQAIEEKKDLKEFAESHIELKQALEFFGKKK
jgi:ribulose-bisphosphate carboxylase large chain